MPRFRLFACLALLPLALLVRAETPTWPENITRENKPWTRWWWLGSAVDKMNLTRELEAIAAAGFGGVEITPIYGAKGAEDRFIPFLSPRYIEMLGHVTAEARRLNLAVDMATGTGWPFGGKHVSKDDAEVRVEIKDGVFQAIPTKFKVKRAAPGAEGWVLDPFSADAMARYLEKFTQALSTLPAGALHGQFHDSFEYTANWTEQLPDAFAKMHGYRLEDQIELLTSPASDQETVARIKSDYRETLSQLHLDYMRTWISWTHARGQIARNQAHGAPATLLDLYGQADIPETEVFGASAFPIPGYRFEKAELSKNEPQPLVNRLASSAAHVMGKPLTSSETFTWLREHFHEAPSEMKPELDQLFLTGVNHIFYHGLAYSPEDAAWPGWLFYASTQANPRNPLWEDFAELNAYIARCQSLLQAGQPDNDFLVYWPVHDQWHRAEGWNRNFSMHGKEWFNQSSTADVARGLLGAGYSFDFVSDAQLQKTNVLERQLQTPGARYRAVIVPAAKRIPAATFERLAALARQGATVLFVGDVPADVPGYGRLAERRAALQKIQSGITWKQIGDTRLAEIGRGQFAAGATLAALLPHARVQPEAAVSAGLSVLRRKLDGGAVYFVANLSANAVDGWVRLNRVDTSALLLDPRSGQTGTAAVRGGVHGGEVYLQLAPGETIFVQSRARAVKNASSWVYYQTAEPAVSLSGPWRGTFVRGGPEVPPPFEAAELASWTGYGGLAERFAGTAAYETEFTLPENATADDWRLELGDVRETARIWVNGQPVDRLWSLPFQARLKGAVKPGKNTLRVEVTNLAANRIRYLDQQKAPWKNFHEINFVNIHYQPFDAAGWELQPSGLLGPVSMVPLKKLQP